MTDKKREYLFLVIVLFVASVLLLANLANSYLWQDEAETALISKTILKHGIPLGHDGKNFFSQVGADAYGEDYIWTLDPWLPYYLLALFFKIFGVSTFTARLPFALFGIATIALTYFFAKSFSKDKKTAAIATTLVILSVPFLNLCRQSRYYVLVAFFSLMGLYGYLLLLEKKRVGSIIFLISAILIFHCNQLFCAALLATVFTHALLCHRQQLAKVRLVSLIAVLANIPWFIWVYEMKLLDIYGYNLFNDSFLRFLISYLQHIFHYIFPAFLLLIPFGKFVFLSIKDKSIEDAVLKDLFLWRNLLLLFLFIGFTITALSIASPCPFFRYLTQLIPAFCVIMAVIIRSAIRSHFRIAITIIAVLLAAVFFVDYHYERAYPGKEGIRYPNFFDYLDEITHDYDGPIEGIVKYLNENGSEDNIVAITCGDLPVKFYTNMRVVGGLTGEDLSPARHADWVILRKHLPARGVADYIVQNVPLDKYRKIIIDYPDVMWENMPSPRHHYFRTVKDEDRVVIYQRKE